MQIHRYGYGIRGFGRFSDYGLRFLAMVSETAQHRYRVLLFWEKHGLKPTMEAFEIKRRTLYQWRKQLREGNHNLESLNEKSRAPRKGESGCGLKRLSRRSGGLGATIQISAKRSFTRLSKVSVIRESKAVPSRKPSGESSPISPIRCAAAQLNSDPKGNESREKRLLRAENPKVIKQPVLENAVPLTP